jgi:hypothetical protein
VDRAIRLIEPETSASCTLFIRYSRNRDLAPWKTFSATLAAETAAAFARCKQVVEPVRLSEQALGMATTRGGEVAHIPPMQLCQAAHKSGALLRRSELAQIWQDGRTRLPHHKKTGPDFAFGPAM